jgi:methylamine dehydrogenase heavy chain
MGVRAAALGLALLQGVATGAAAQLPVEEIGRVEVLPQPPGAHWVWVSDLLLRRRALLDLDRGVFLGMVSTGYMSPTAVFSRHRPEFYLPETYYARGSRGARSDVVSIYDTATLAPVAEVEIPPRRAMNVLPSGNAALSDDDRFLAVFNMTPATSVSIVDVEQRRFVAEIATPGCSLVYAAGPRRFLMLCGDGAPLSIELDERGREARRVRGEPFFDPETDPVTEKAVRSGDLWLFVSFEGMLHPVDVSGEVVRALPPWSLLDEADRSASWRIGGVQHLAVHEASGRLFSLVHQGGDHGHKDPGRELWTYDLGERRRVQRLTLRHPGLSFLGEGMEFGSSWVWPFHRLSDWVTDYVLPHPGIHAVQVTQDAQPLLVTGSQMGGSLAVYEATSGRFLRRVGSGNLMTHSLQAPWGQARGTR